MPAVDIHCSNDITYAHGQYKTLVSLEPDTQLSQNFKGRKSVLKALANLFIYLVS